MAVTVRDVIALVKENIPIGVWVIVGLVGIWTVAGIHFALAEGQVPGLHPGYCKLDTGCPATVAAVNNLQTSDLRSAMRANHNLLCGADTATEQDRYQEYIDQDQEAYIEINNGEPYNLRMDCPS